MFVKYTILMWNRTYVKLNSSLLCMAYRGFGCSQEEFVAPMFKSHPRIVNKRTFKNHFMRLTLSMTMTATFGRNKRRFPLLKVCPRSVFQFISNWFTCISQRYGFCYSTKYWFLPLLLKDSVYFPHSYYSHICMLS